MNPRVWLITGSSSGLGRNIAEAVLASGDHFVATARDPRRLDAVIKALASFWGNEMSDPAKVAQLILRLATEDQLPAHLLIGSDAVEFAGQAEPTRKAEAERSRDVSASTDGNASVDLPATKF